MEQENSGNKEAAGQELEEACEQPPVEGTERKATGDDAWAYRVEVAVLEERITQLEKWKQDKMSNIQSIWTELGAKHVKLGQEQEQLEKLTKLIEKETQEIEALKSKYQQEDCAVSPLDLSSHEFSKFSDVGQIPPVSLHERTTLDQLKRGMGRPHPTNLIHTQSVPTGKRKRGRPTKLDSMSRNPSINTSLAVDGSTGKKPRGRPRKYPKPFD